MPRLEFGVPALVRLISSAYGGRSSGGGGGGARMEGAAGGTQWGGGMLCHAEAQARIGLLMLRRGEWNGKRILPESWVAESLVPRLAGHVGGSAVACLLGRCMGA